MLFPLLLNCRYINKINKVKQCANFYFNRYIFDRFDFKTDKHNAKSGVSYIEVRDDNPFYLLKIWAREAQVRLSYAQICSLATISPEGNPSIRHMKIYTIRNEQIILSTNKNTRHYKHIVNHGCVSLGFSWIFKNKYDEHLKRQVIIKGSCEFGDKKLTKRVFDAEPLSRKIQAQLYKTNETIKWKKHKMLHDEKLNEIITKKLKILPMPDNYVTYVIDCEEMEFYENSAYKIPDRVVFTKFADKWRHKHVAP